MKLGIIGAGAMGQFFSAYIYASHTYDVCLYTRTKEQANLIESYGIYLHQANKKQNIKVSVKEIEKISACDVLIFTVKQYALKDVLSILLQPQFHECTLVFLQNGMSHLEDLEKLPQHNIYVGTIAHGVTRMGVNEIAHKGVGLIRLSNYRGQDKDFEQLFQSLHVDSWFPVKFGEDYMTILLDKLYINAVINPLTAMLRVKNGALSTNPNFRKLAMCIFEELDTVFSFGGQKEKIWDTIVQAMQATAQNESSMLQDVKFGRKTEIEGIYGYIIKEAEKRKKNLHYIPFVYEVICGLEADSW